MLLRFAVSNYLSFDEEQELSLVASALKGNDDCVTHVPGSKYRALPMALIYGPNASGKSNLVAALQYVANAVDQSHRSGNPEGGVPRFPFALDPNNAEKNSTFEIDFVTGGVRYHFGFHCDSNSFNKEWLFYYPQGTKRKLYERTSPNEIDFGPSMKGPKSILSSLMRPNSLFLSTAAQNNHSELGKIAAYFSSIQFNGDIAVDPPTVAMEFSKKEIDERAVEILTKLGTGVVGFTKTKTKITDNQRKLRDGIFAVVSQVSGRDLTFSEEDDEDTVIALLHQSTDEKKIAFDLARESSGTRRLLVLAASVLSALDRGNLVVIDELDASLHTQAAEVLMSLFADPSFNKHGAQIVATTHDTNLMMAECLRRDAIWFAEKDNAGASSIYPLTDFQLRITDNLEKGYMQGRFGALPFSGSALDWLKSHLGT